MSKSLVFVAVLAVVLALDQGMAGEPQSRSRDGEPLEATGIGSDHEGRRFAILKDLGVVHEGQRLSFSCGGKDYEIEILAIGEKNVLVRKTITSVTRPVEQPVTKKKSTTEDKGKTALRDPFCPVGYDDAPTDE